jgi:hypothetical protein
MFIPWRERWETDFDTTRRVLCSRNVGNLDETLVEGQVEFKVISVTLEQDKTRRNE